MVKKFADKLLRAFCYEEYYPDIQGDLEEIYTRRGKTGSKTKAEWHYLFQVLSLMRPSLMKTPKYNNIIETSMLRNYLKIGTRNLLKQRFFTVVNVLGLAIGLSSFLLINEYVRFERSYDSFHHNADNLYRLSTLELVNDKVESKDAMAYQQGARVLYEELPEITNFTTSYVLDGITFRKGSKVIKEKHIVTADTNFLEVFNYPVIAGSVKEMLTEPYSIVLTKSKAEFYFGDEDPIGQSIELLDDFNRACIVTGVIEDVPDNTHYKFDILMSHRTLEKRWDYTSWNANNYYGYVVLKEGSDFTIVNQKVRGLSEKYLGEETTSIFDISPVIDIHLKSDYTFESSIPGNENAVIFMSIISIFILIIAWVNYINLSTARAVQRAKEVGLRKVIGAYRGQLLTQFILESMIVNFFAAAFALLISEAVLPFYNSLIGTTLTGHFWNYTPFLQNLFIFFIIGTIVSGFYPAMVLSKFPPVTTLKGSFNTSKAGVNLRKALVIFQFAASIVLIAGTFTVYRQLNYMQSKDMGINVDYVLGLLLPDFEDEQAESFYSSVETFKDEMRAHSAIEHIGATSNLPGGGSADINSTTNEIRLVGITEDVPGTTYVQWNDDGFLDAVGMQLVAGRNFDRGNPSDSSSVMVNQAFLRKLEVLDPEKAVNEMVDLGWGEDFRIIGIVKDYNRMSLKAPVEPTVYMPSLNPSNLVIKLNPEQYRDGLDHLEAKWSEHFPDNPIDYSFLDQRFDSLYQQDKRFGEVYLIFSVLAILIATLGLFGLTSFIATQRTKEVGVRKVLGASISSIIGIFFKDFIILLILAALIGVPVVYFSMSLWLESYAYRIDFPWLLAILSVFIVIGFALITVGVQTFKVAVLNPANTLKYE